MTAGASLPATAVNRFLFGLSLAQLISWGSTFYLFGLLVQPLEAELQISRAQSSLGFSLMLLAEGALAYPVGRWIDRGHARRVMCTGAVLAALCLLPFPSHPCCWCLCPRALLQLSPLLPLLFVIAAAITIVVIVVFVESSSAASTTATATHHVFHSIPIVFC